MSMAEPLMPHPESPDAAARPGGEEAVLGEHEPTAETSGAAPVAPVSSAPALQRRDAGGETS